MEAHDFFYWLIIAVHLISPSFYTLTSRTISLHRCLNVIHSHIHILILEHAMLMFDLGWPSRDLGLGVYFDTKARLCLCLTKTGHHET